MIKNTEIGYVPTKVFVSTSSRSRRSLELVLVRRCLSLFLEDLHKHLAPCGSVRVAAGHERTDGSGAFPARRPPAPLAAAGIN